MGDNNSSKVILDKCSTSFSKLYLKNDFYACAAQIKAAVSSQYELIFILGQKPVIKSIFVELMGRSFSSSLQTNYDYYGFVEFLKASGYGVRLSDNAGNFLCNHVYFYGLKAIHDSNAHTKMLFVHTPYLKNISDVDHLAETFSVFLTNY